jgi:hypothetical protein
MHISDEVAEGEVASTRANYARWSSNLPHEKTKGRGNNAAADYLNTPASRTNENYVTGIQR